MQAFRVANMAPAYAPPARARFEAPRYRPPAWIGGDPSSLGKSKAGLGGFSIDRLPTSILLMTSGAAGLFVGDAFPSPVNVIVKGAGIAMLGYGVFYLFNEPSGPVKPAGAQREPTATPSPEAFATFHGAIISPTSGTRAQKNTFSDTFDVKLIWYNDSKEKANFTFDILGEAYAPGPAAPPVKSQVLFTGTVDLPPLGNSGPVTQTLPLWSIRPEKLEPYATQFWLVLTLRKLDAAGKPVPIGEPVRVFVDKA